MKRKITAVILTIAMLAGMIPAASMTAYAQSFNYRGYAFDIGSAAYAPASLYDDEYEDEDLILTFTGNDTLYLPVSVMADVLVVGGGGGGGWSSKTYGCGGNGGIVRYGQYVLPSGNYIIVVGAGGTGAAKGTSSGVRNGKSGNASSISFENAGAFPTINAGGGSGGDGSSSGAGTPDVGCILDITGDFVTYGKGGKEATETADAGKAGVNYGDGGTGNTKSKSGGDGHSGVVIIRIVGFVHDEYEYSAEGSKLIANCNDGESISSFSLSLTDKGIFDADELAVWEREGFEKPDIEYYQDGMPHVGKCFTPGNYTAKATVGNAVAVKEFTVTDTDGHVHIENGRVTSYTTPTSTLPAKKGNYYLTSDVKLARSWNAPSGEVNLCLNGHIINLNGNRYQMVVGTGRTLNIDDCGTTEHYFNEVTDADGQKYWSPSSSKKADSKTVTGGVITGGQNKTTSGDAMGGALKITEGGTCTLYGGNIIGNYCYSSSYYAYGGGVYVDSNAVFYMYGGSIRGNSCVSKSRNGCGGGILIDGVLSTGVYSDPGKAYVYGGVISDNFVSHYGGGVYAFRGPLTVGGTTVIRGNTTQFEKYLSNGDTENNVMTGSGFGNPSIYIQIGTDENAPAESMDIGVRRETVTSPICAKTDNYSTNFSSDNAGLHVIYDANDKNICLESGVAQNTKTNEFFTKVSDALAAASEGQTVILLRDISEEAKEALTVKSGVTLDLNGFDLYADSVISFGGLVINSKGSADGKLFTAKDKLVYSGGKDVSASEDYILPVWDGNGYIFCSVNDIWQEWKAGLDGESNPKFRFQPRSADIVTVFGEDGGISAIVNVEYKKNGEEEYSKLPDIDFAEYISLFMENPTGSAMFVTFSGAESVTEIKATASLKADCGLRIVGETMTSARS